MRGLRTIFGRIFGRSAEERTTGPGPAGRLRNDSAAPGATRAAIATGRQGGKSSALTDELAALREKRTWPGAFRGSRPPDNDRGNGYHTRKTVQNRMDEKLSRRWAQDHQRRRRVNARGHELTRECSCYACRYYFQNGKEAA